jgi:hypothetical protein
MSFDPNPCWLRSGPFGNWRSSPVFLATGKASWLLTLGVVLSCRGGRHLLPVLAAPEPAPDAINLGWRRSAVTAPTDVISAKRRVGLGCTGWLEATRTLSCAFVFGTCSFTAEREKKLYFIFPKHGHRK